MALCPFAKHLLITPGSSDPRITPRAAILHVDAGNALSLFSFFRDRSGGIESHFHITLTGKIEQYRDTAWQADANHLANDFGVSIETQGFGSGKWTAAQMTSIKRLLIWLNETHDIPLRQIPAWNSSGVGYHIQFGSPGPWTPVSKSCPGPERIKQYHGELVPWMNSNPTAPEEDIVASIEDLRKAIREEVAPLREEIKGLRARLNETAKAERVRDRADRRDQAEHREATEGDASPRS